MGGNRHPVGMGVCWINKSVYNDTRNPIILQLQKTCSVPGSVCFVFWLPPATVEIKVLELSPIWNLGNVVTEDMTQWMWTKSVCSFCGRWGLSRVGPCEACCQARLFWALPVFPDQPPLTSVLSNGIDALADCSSSSKGLALPERLSSILSMSCTSFSI